MPPLRGHGVLAMADGLLSSSMTLNLGSPALALAEETQSNSIWWYAVVLTLAGRSVEALGLMLQKAAHEKMQDDDDKRPYCFTSGWLGGFAVYVCGHMLNFLGLGMGTQTVLSCLACWCTITTIFLAPIFLGETVTIFRMISVLFLVVGCIWVVMVGPRGYQIYTVGLFAQELHNPYFIAMSAFTLLLLIGFAVEAIVTKARPRLSSLKYVLIAAVLGWYSVLSAKCTSGLFFTSWHYRQNQFITWETWVIAAFLITIAVLSLHFMNRGLATGDAVFVIPVSESVAISGQILLGGIFFGEFDSLTPVEQLVFWGGVMCIVVGVIMGSMKHPEQSCLQHPVLSPPSKPVFSPCNSLWRSAEND